jgi:protein SCO1/2
MQSNLLKTAVVSMVLALTVGCGASTPATPTPSPTPPPDNIVPINPPITLTDFSLPNSAGGTTTLADWKNKFTLVTFGYTHCPDVCPINLADFKQVHQAMDTLADKMNFVFVSVDGARDTPDILAAHLKLFDTSILGLTGTDTAIQILTKQFGVYYKLEKTKPEQTDYSVTHTASSFLVDSKGRITRIYDYGFDPDVIGQDIRKQINAG